MCRLLKTRSLKSLIAIHPDFGCASGAVDVHLNVVGRGQTPPSPAEPELPLEPELLFEPESPPELPVPPLDPELPLDPEPPLELALPLEPE
jgi:hypothetical protein